MSEQHNWYTMIPERDRAIVDAAAEWLRPVSWQWFVTLTFPWNVKSETADFKLKKWLNQIEKTLKGRVCFVAGKERKNDSYGMGVPWHFHVLVASTVAIPQGLLEDSWKTLVSLGARCLQKDNAVDDSVLVTPYKHNLKGPEYCLKALSSCNGDWHFRWLELFNPRIRQTGTPNHLTIRQRARLVTQLDASR